MSKKPPSSRPSYIPRGYEWLPEACNRVFGVLGAEGRELVHQMLAEGDVGAMLLNRVGNDYPVPKRMWRKFPDERKVYARFADGWMRFSLKPKKFVCGWLFVPEGAFSSLIDPDNETESWGRTSAKHGIDIENHAPIENQRSHPETRREERKRETKEKYQRWFELSQEIKAEGKYTRPTDIASAVAKRETARMKEKGIKEKGVNGPNIHRRLNDQHPGWVE